MGIFVDMVNRHRSKAKSRNDIYWCEVYKVHGINPKTNRKKAVEVVESSNAPEELIQSKSGLLPPYEVEISTRPASEAQLEVLKKHGITPPPNLSMTDAGVFISRSIHGEPINQPPASMNFVNYAIENDIYISKYASRKEVQEYLISELPEKKNEIRSLN